MSNKLTPIMIIGSGKSGTTTLYKHLIKHPQICGGIIKEPEYFTLKRGDKYKEGKYEDLFVFDPMAHSYTLDASTGYSMCHVEEGVPQRMKDLGLNPYFIYIIRNPFERIRSHYNFNKRNLEWKLNIDSTHLIETSMYFKQLQEYVKVYGRERLLLLEFEDLKNNPTSLCDRVFEFIGAEDFKMTLDKKEIKNKTKATNRTRIRISQSFSFIRTVLPPKFQNKIRSLMSLAFPAKQKFLSIEQKSKIKRELQGDMNKLNEHYNVEISKWGF